MCRLPRLGHASWERGRGSSPARGRQPTLRPLHVRRDLQTRWGPSRAAALEPFGEEAQRFAGELSCEALRPQLQRLMQSHWAPSRPAPTAPSEVRLFPQAVCSPKTARASALRLIACGRSRRRKRFRGTGATSSARGYDPKSACSWKASTSRTGAAGFGG